ncbi:hypothetical protein Tco_0900451 [Tanacetum coccineum]
MENENPSSFASNSEFLDPNKKIEIKSWLEDSRMVDSLVGLDEIEYFDTFPTLEELEYHEWLLKYPKPSWVKAKIRTENLNNIKISCMIGHFLKIKAYINLESPVNVIFDKKKLGRSWDVFIGRLLEDDLTSYRVSIGIDIPMLPLDDIRSGQTQFHLSQLRMSWRSISRIKSSSRHEVTIPNPVFRCSEIWGCDRLVSEPLGYRELGCIREMSQSLSSNVPDNSPEQEAATGHSIPRRLDSPTSQAT